MSYQRIPIGDVVSLRQGFAINKKTKHHISEEPTELYLLRIGDMKEGSFSVYAKDTIPKHFIADEDDIIYTRTGQVGLVFRKQRGVIHNNCFSVAPKDENQLDRGYLFYALQTKEFYEEANLKASGAAQPDLPHGAFNSISICLPQIDIQKRISRILQTYDELIENNQRQIKLLEEAAQRLYKEWFVDLRFPGHEDVEIVDGVPEGWKKVCLDDVLEKITTGLNPRKNFVLGKGKNYYVTIKNMGDNDVVLDEKCDKVDDEAIEKINNRSDLRVGDFLFSGIGTMGRVYWVCIPTSNWNVSESVFTMRANEKISKEYLYMVLLSPDIQNYCDQNAHGVAQRGIRMADLKSYRFLLPSNNVLETHTRMAGSMIRNTQLLREENKKLKEARDRLLPKLMSGEIEL